MAGDVLQPQHQLYRINGLRAQIAIQAQVKGIHAVHPCGIARHGRDITAVQPHGAVPKGTLILENAFQMRGNPVNRL